jgi:type II secretory pathway component PulC
MKNISLIKKISILFVFVFLAVLAVITADITVTLIGKSIKIPFKKSEEVSSLKERVEKKRELIYFREIFDHNIFNVSVLDENFFEKKKKEEADSVTEEFADVLEPVTDEKVISEFDVEKYELYGTMTANPKNLSYATIYNKSTKKYEIYGLKEYNRFIEDVHEIIDITRDSVEIKTQGGESVILKLKEKKAAAPREPRRSHGRELPPKSPARPARDMKSSINQGITRVSEDRYIIDQRLYQDLTKDVSSLMSLQRQISFIPKLDENKNPIGFEIRRITPGSLFQKIGLRRGDTVKSVNGRVLNAMSVQGALQLLNEMKNETDINLGINRNKTNKNIGYEVR